MSQALTPVEAEQMRSILQRYDNDRKPVQIHNLNDPPKVPYRYQKFPKMLYNHEQSEPAHEVTKSAIVGSSVIEERVHVRAKVVTIIVHNESDLAEYLADGWREDAPEFRADLEDTLSRAYEAEAARADDQLRRKPGRPRKDAGAA
jgi:hypothetical protein